ncbi:hypothetical protein DESACE_06385 [Desulfurella acetivorans A63]|nr:hypothetical protein DESACE_06385 [Desulfurella acetivorans A63]
MQNTLQTFAYSKLYKKPSKKNLAKNLRIVNV